MGWWYKTNQSRSPQVGPGVRRMEMEEAAVSDNGGGSTAGGPFEVPRADYPPELLASQRTMEELGLPEALLVPLEDEVNMSGPTTLLQAAILSEGRTGANFLVQGPSGSETTVALSMLLLKQLLDRGVVSAGDMQPWEGCRESGEEKIKSDGTGFWAGLRKSSAESQAAKEASSETPVMQALVLARNKEIATNVTDTLTRFGQCIPNLEVVSLVGGVPVAEHVRTLARGCHIAVGTPGRVRYLIGKGALQPSAARTLVLESADCLMAPVFQEDVGCISGKFPESKQVLAFSSVDASTVKPALCALVGVSELRELGLVGGAAHATRKPGSSEGTAGGGEKRDGDSEVRWPSPMSEDNEPSAEAVARASDVSAAATAFLMSGGRGASGEVGRTSIASAVKDARIGLSVDAQSVTSSSTSGSQHRQQSPRSQARVVAAAKAAAAEIVGKDRDPLKVATAVSVASSTSTATATPSPPSMRARSQRASRPAQTSRVGHSPALAPGSPPPPPPPGSAHSSSASGDSTTEVDGPPSTVGGSGDASATPHSPRPQSFSGGGSRQSSQSASRKASTATPIGNAGGSGSGGSSSSFAAGGDDAADKAWRGDSGGSVREGSDNGSSASTGRSDSGTHEDVVSSTSSQQRREREDRTSLGLLSPGAVKKDAETGTGVPAVGKNGTSNILQTVAAAGAVMPVGGGGMDVASSATAAAAAAEVHATTVSRTSTEVVVCDEDPAQYYEEQQQKQLELTTAAVTLLEEWDIPPVLLAALEADGFVVPTALQASVWTAGRGMYRADLLVHGRPGDETATAYAVLILERVWLRYPPAVEPRQDTMSDEDVHAERANNPPAPLELQALVLTRTRDMAATVTDELLRLGRGMDGLVVATLIGGVPVAEQSKALAGGCHVAVGTPGRVRFLMTKGLLRPHSAKTLVLDSADWLMATVFQEDVGWIASRFPMDKQVLAFSGADPSAIEEGLKELVNSPHMTSVGGSSSTVVAKSASDPASAAEASQNPQGAEAMQQAFKNGSEDSAISPAQDAENEATAAAAAAVANAERELIAAEEELKATLAHHGGVYSSNNVGTIKSAGGGVDAAGAREEGRTIESQVPAIRKTYRQAQDGQHESGELAVIRNNGFGAVTLTASGKAAAGVPGFSVDPPGMMTSRLEGSNMAAASREAQVGARHAASAVGSRSMPKTGAGGSGASFRTRVRLSRENQLYGAWCRQSIGGVGASGRR